MKKTSSKLFHYRENDLIKIVIKKSSVQNSLNIYDDLELRIPCTLQWLMNELLPGQLEHISLISIQAIFSF